MIKWSVNHRSIVFLICLFVMLAGVFIYSDLERQENPNVIVPKAIIQCIYPGASPSDVEKLIVKPIESKIKEIAEIKTIKSYSKDSIGVLVITLKDLSDSDISNVWEEVQGDLDEVKGELPGDAWEPDLDTDVTETYGMLITLSSDRYSYKNIQNLSDELKKRLEEDPGVKGIEIDGEINEEIDINLDMVKLQQYGIPPTQIVKVLKARNVNIPGGNLEIGKIKVPIQTTGEYKDLDEILATVVDMSEDGNPIYLKDVANIIKTEEKREEFITVNNKKAVVVGVKYTEGKNIVKITKRLRKIIDEFKPELYEGVELSIFTDQASFVEEAITLFENNLYSAIALVVLVVLVAMGLRSAVVVSATIPLVIMTVFVSMRILGIELHQVSIGSLIISLSLLIANGIVANDSIYLYMEKGKDRKTSCIMGVKEVKVAILTSTLTSIASFLPLSMMKGAAGKFVSSLPILVSVALFSSYIYSLTVVPAMAFSILKVKPKATQKSEGIVSKIYHKLKLDTVAERIVKVYRVILKRSLSMPKIVLLIALVSLIGSMAMIPSLGVQLFPYVERNQYIIDVSIQDGSTAESTGKVVENIGRILSEDNSVDMVMSKVGDGPLKYYVTFIANTQGTNKAQIIVNGDIDSISKIQKKLNKEIAGANINIKRLENAVPADYPIDIRIAGEDTEELKRIAYEIKGLVEPIPGGKSIEDNFGADSYKLKVKVNEVKANMVGLTNYDIASTVRMAISGYEATKLKQKNLEDDDIPVIVKIPEANKHSREVLNNIYFTSTITGENIPVSQVATIENEFTGNTIIRRNGERTISVGMFVKEGYNTAKIQKQVEEVLANYELPKGYKLTIGGASEERNEAFSSMVIPAIFAVLVIYLILVLQFSDLTEPLIIMGTIPLSFIGVIVGLKITGYPIGFMALLGAISLMGVVVNNGIVLLDYIKLLNSQGSELKDAIIEACATRIRPIAIGMMTTVISLIPLGVSGGDLWAPLAYAIIFGMMISSVLTLIIIPVSYMLLENFKKHTRVKYAKDEVNI